MSFITSLFGAGKARTTMPSAVSGLQLQSSTQGLPVSLVYGTTRIAPNLIWYGDFVATAQQSSAGSGGKGGVGGGGGGKGGGGSTQYIYQTAVALGLCEGPIQGVGNVYVNKNITSLSSLGLSLFTGSYSQSPWGYLTTNHSAQAINYHGIAYLAASAYQLGNSPQLPNHNFEVKGIYSNSISGQQDADPSLVITDLLTNSHYGAGFPATRLATLTTYQAYCIANGLWVSPAYNQQAQAATILDDLATATNSAFVWSSGTLTLVPYGDQSITANGYTYTAPSQAQYDLTDDDFMLTGSNTDPVKLIRKRPADKINSIKLECLDRANSYNPAIIEAKDQAFIDVFGLRQSPSKQTHLFADLNAGRLSAQLQLQRQAIQNVYQFTLDQRYILLDPMDIVTLTDSNLGLNRQWVRILEITEQDDGTLDFIAEEYLNGTGSAPAYSFQGNSGYNINYNGAPGNANTPVIFEPPVQISKTGGLEVDIAVSGGSNWGGCDVWISTDGNTYKQAGRINGSARQGVLTATLASGSDPDTVNTLSVDLTQSAGALLSGTQNDADNFHTLCYVDGEIVSYQNAALTSAYHYNLTYLRRGCYGTTISSHANGTQFARLDGGIYAYAYDKSKIGQTIYIKLLGFNIVGGGEQALSDVNPYTYTIKGPPLPGQVQGFQAQQSGNVVVFNWTDLATDSALKGYDIAYGASGSAWANKQLLTEAHRGTEMTNASVPPGTWEFSIRARDIADNLSAVASTVQLVVTNTNSIISQAAQEPDWLGTISGFYKHYTGVLVPLSQHNASYYTVLSAPATPSLSQVAGGSIGATTYYVKITYTDANGETTVSSEQSLAVSANKLLQVASPSASGLATGWNVYVSTSAGTETKQNGSTPIQIGANWTLPTTGLVSGAAMPTMNTTGWQVFNQFVPDPVATASYIAPTVDTGYNATLRVYATMNAIMGPGQTGQPSLQFDIDTWLTGQSDPGTYTPWTTGLTNLRYLNAKLIDTITAGSVAYITDFTPTIDNAALIENSSAGGVVISPGGTVITFPTPYHNIPNVVATVVSAGSGLYATVSAISTTQCTIHVWNSSGTDVGGTVNWQATGN